MAAINISPDSVTSTNDANCGLRIGLLGLFGSGNFGNDGSLAAFVAHLRTTQPGARLSVICDGPSIITQRFGLPACAMMSSPVPSSRSMAGKLVMTPLAKLWNFFRAIAITRKIDVLITPGTGLLDDFATGPLGLPADLFCWCLAARLTGTKIMFLNIGAGPLVHPLSRWLMLASARMAHLRSYRDQASKTYLARLGVDTQHDQIYPDIAFKLPLPAPSTADRVGGELTIGLGVMTYRGWAAKSSSGEAIYDRYLAELSKVATSILSDGHTVRLISGDDSDQSSVNDFARRLKNRLGSAAAGRIILNPVNSLDGVMLEMAQTDCVIATRFHNIVCALKMRKPVLSIGYAQKNRVLLEGAGLEAYCSDIETFDADTVLHQLHSLLANRIAIKRQISALLDTIDSRLRQQDQALAQTLLEPGRAHRRHQNVVAPAAAALTHRIKKA
jgi:polysaccharide pyruvyl transferase WcaK-like protein